MNKSPQATNSQGLSLEAFILSGGLSSRMGRNKSSLRLGGRTMQGHVQGAVEEDDIPARIIREDVVARCGPLGGIFTGLKKSRAEMVLFLACDMPFVTSELVRWFVDSVKLKDRALFMSHGDCAGFPILLRREACLALVAGQIQKSQFSLQSLASVLDARLVRPGRKQMAQLENINTPEDFEKARIRMAQRKGSILRSKSV